MVVVVKLEESIKVVKSWRCSGGQKSGTKVNSARTNIVDARALPTCPRCQSIFRARIGLVGHLQTQCTNNPTILISSSNSANPPSNSPIRTPGINTITSTLIETTSQYASPVTPTTAFAATAVTTTTTNINEESLLSCLQCDGTFTSRIGLIGHLRIHRTETGEPVPGAPTHSRDSRLHCPYCPRHSLIAWAYLVTCASMTAEFTTMPTTLIHHAHTPLLPFLPPLPPHFHE
ncbi:unnamed protein product [Schistocephalus solidus]|uniref:C2H2-type domain-containing protein n=1 Tax=Schistocephalus solidus TaxID=70667 RepID=A0A183T1X9_SCHSO|nr:unnamed protein product [Schistocephalus solidus]